MRRVPSVKTTSGVRFGYTVLDEDEKSKKDKDKQEIKKRRKDECETRASGEDAEHFQEVRD